MPSSAAGCKREDVPGELPYDLNAWGDVLPLSSRSRRTP